MCQCFLCKNKGNEDKIIGYLAGQKDAYEMTLKFLESQGIKPKMTGNEYEKFVACVQDNYEEVCTFLYEFKYCEEEILN